MMRTIIACLFIILTSCGLPVASADVGGYVPGPDLCPYPGVGASGMEFGVYHYTCDSPTEINGSHRHCVYGGAAAMGTISAGVNILIFNAGASLSAPVGVLEGACWWACPDLTLAEQPNPVAAWANYVKPTKCKSVGPNPMTPLVEGASDGSNPPPIN